MERLTHERVNGIKTGYWSAATKEALVQKLAAYENTGYEPDEIRAAIEQAAKNSETNLEVEQPESEFLLRVDPDEGIGFFEADGGIWKLEAKKNIADYFLKNMGDLIDAGKVVVMQ